MTKYREIIRFQKPIIQNTIGIVITEHAVITRTVFDANAASDL